MLTLPLIHEASRFLKKVVRETELEFSPDLSNLLGVPVHLKLEFLQLTGSFKIRGAYFYLSTLSSEEKARGVAACSAGNHGLGVAYAARETGIPCTVYVPKSVDPIKEKKILRLGAEVKRSPFIGYDETLDWAKGEAERHHHLISAFDDARIMAANGGSVAVEIFEQLPSVQHLIAPVGGGGLSAGLAYYAKEKSRSVEIIGCQHRDSPALQLSMEKGRAVTSLPPIETAAGGIEGGIGAKCFDVLRTTIDHVHLSSEEEIRSGMMWMLSNHQYLIEPSSAVAVAYCLSQQEKKLDGPVAIVLTGRNVRYP